MRKRPVIVQHVFGSKNSGGPVVALQRLVDANIHGEFEFVRMAQPMPAGGINIALLRAFREQLLEVKPDMIHVRGLGNEGFHGVLAARLAGVRRILVSVHGTVRDLQFPSSRMRTALVRDVLEPATLKMATHIMTVCHYAAQRDFLDPYRHKLIGVVPNGVDVPPQEIVRSHSIRQRNMVGNGDVVAVCVSRISKEKGYFVLAEALQVMPRFNNVLHVWIVGDGPDRAEIERAMPRRDDVKVTFFGHSNAVGSILAEADLFLFPSLHENLSNALIEGMSYGLPPVAFSVGGNSEVLANGVGKLVEPGNAEMYAQAMFDYVRNRSLIFSDGVVARERVAQHYSIDMMVRGVYDAYRNVLGMSPA